MAPLRFAGSCDGIASVCGARAQRSNQSEGIVRLYAAKAWRGKAMAKLGRDGAVRHSIGISVGMQSEGMDMPSKG